MHTGGVNPVRGILLTGLCKRQFRKDGKRCKLWILMNDTKEGTHVNMHKNAMASAY